MVRWQLTLVALGALNLSASPAIAATEVSPATRQLAVAVVNYTARSTDVETASLVRSAQSYCAEVAKVYPRNSPADSQWIKSEGHGGGDRPERLMQSAEFGRLLAANFTEGCAMYAANYKAPSFQRTALIGLAYTFIQFRDAPYYAVKNGVDVDRYGLATLSFTTEAFLLAALKAKP